MHTLVDYRPFKHEPQESEGQFKGIYAGSALIYYLDVVWVELTNIRKKALMPGPVNKS